MVDAIGEALSMSSTKGLTLIELVVSIAIAVVLMTAAIPSLHGLIIRNRLINIANTLMGALHYARIEAIRRGQGVTLCKSSDGSTCVIGGKDWEIGWIAFVDTDKNGRRDPSSEALLRTWPALPSGYTLRPNNNFDNFLRYNPRGEANNIGTFAICYRNQLIGAKAIIVTRQRPRLGHDSNNNGIPETSSGDITGCFL